MALKNTPQRRQVILWSALMACLILGLATLATFGARLHWLLELSCHFHLQHVFAALAPAAALLYLRRWLLATIPAALLAYHLWMISPLLPAWHQPSTGPGGIRVVVANVLTSNPHKDQVRAFLKEANPDFFVLVETNQQWSDAMADFSVRYPYSHKVPRIDNFGMVLYSRLPIVSLARHIPGEARLPLLVAQLQCEDGMLTVIAAHPLPPISRRNASERLIYLRVVEEQARLARGAVMVVGDLNITAGSPYYRDLLAGGRLRDSRRGFGLQPSWPGLIWPLRMCVDHVLASEHVTITGRQLGPSVGSDHLPVVVDFKMPP